jgi:predicted nucleic acid-binding protein
VILVDANIPMYAAGADHPNKAPSGALLAAAAEGRIEAALDAETLQEILHRYRAIGRWQDGRSVYDACRRIFEVVLPIDAEILDRARGLLDEHVGLGARDALHAAVVSVHGLDGICSFDRGFDGAGVRRLEPGALLAG